MRWSFHVGAVISLFIAFALTGIAAAAEVTKPAKVTLSCGYNYITGKYGRATATTVSYAPVTLKVKEEHWVVKVTVPYISVSGPGVGGSDGGDLGGVTSTGTEKGLGDLQIGYSYLYTWGSPDLTGDMTVKFKLPTADAHRNLGTGKMDYTVQAGLNRNFGDFYVSGSAGRKMNGSSDRFRLRDVWRYSVGGGMNVNPYLMVGASYDFREASSATGHSVSQVTGFMNYNLTDTWSVQVYAGTGFTVSSPDFSTGVQLNYKFNMPDLDR